MASRREHDGEQFEKSRPTRQRRNNIIPLGRPLTPIHVCEHGEGCTGAKARGWDPPSERGKDKKEASLMQKRTWTKVLADTLEESPQTENQGGCEKCQTVSQSMGLS